MCSTFIKDYKFQYHRRFKLWKCCMQEKLLNHLRQTYLASTLLFLNKSWARSHQSFKFSSKLKYLYFDFMFYSLSLDLTTNYCYKICGSIHWELFWKAAILILPTWEYTTSVKLWTEGLQLSSTWTPPLQFCQFLAYKL